MAGRQGKRKNRRAVLTLRQDWVEQQTMLHRKDKRKKERRGKGEKVKRGRVPVSQLDQSSKKRTDMRDRRTEREKHN